MPHFTPSADSQQQVSQWSRQMRGRRGRSTAHLCLQEKPSNACTVSPIHYRQSWPCRTRIRQLWAESNAEHSAPLQNVVKTCRNCGAHVITLTPTHVPTTLPGASRVPVPKSTSWYTVERHQDLSIDRDGGCFPGLGFSWTDHGTRLNGANHEEDQGAANTKRPLPPAKFA